MKLLGFLKVECIAFHCRLYWTSSFS